MSYAAEIAALTDITAGQTLAEAGHANRHNQANDALRALATALDGELNVTLPPQAGLTIIETATGTWSGDAPVRTAGVNPIEFRGWSDPADATNGITTPANIRDTDIWTVLPEPV